MPIGCGANPVPPCGWPVGDRPRKGVVLELFRFALQGFGSEAWSLFKRPQHHVGRHLEFWRASLCRAFRALNKVRRTLCIGSGSGSWFGTHWVTGWDCCGFPASLFAIFLIGDNTFQVSGHLGVCALLMPKAVPQLEKFLEHRPNDCRVGKQSHASRNPVGFVWDRTLLGVVQVQQAAVCEIAHQAHGHLHLFRVLIEVGSVLLVVAHMEGVVVHRQSPQKQAAPSSSASNISR